MKNYIATFLLIVSGTSAYSAEADLKKVEDILERLEKRILDQEGASTNYGEAPVAPAPKQKIEGKPEKIKADIQENNKLKEIATSVAEIEQELDKLESDVQKTKQKILENSSIESSLDLAFVPPNADSVGIRSLRVTLDGLTIYELSQPSGVWAPNRMIPLFNGPIVAGVHKLEVDLNIVDKNKRGLPLNQDSFKSVRKVFSLNVSSRGEATRYSIHLSSKGTQSDLILRSKELPIAPPKLTKAAKEESKEEPKKESTASEE